MWWITLLVVGAALWWFTSSSAAKRSGPISQVQPDLDSHNAPDHNDKDNWEGSFWEVQKSHLHKKNVVISYTDGNGNQTKRSVDIRSFEPSRLNGLVIGHCQLRDETRTFRYDRISDCVDAETGEVIPDLRVALENEYSSTPAAVATSLADEFQDLLKILFYVAKADGVMRAAEVIVMVQACRNVTGNQSLDAATIKAATGQIDLMTMPGFESACRRLKTHDTQQFHAAYEAAKGIVGTQKTVHPNELAALAVMASLSGQK